MSEWNLFFLGGVCYSELFAVVINTYQFLRHAHHLLFHPHVQRSLTRWPCQKGCYSSDTEYTE